MTKIDETNFDYTPHLNCVDPERGSAESDGLVLHYKFDDFQEHTENQINQPVILESSSANVMPSGWRINDSNYSYGVVEFGVIDNGMFGANSIYTIVDSNEWQNRWDIFWTLDDFVPDAYYTFSIWGKTFDLSVNPRLVLNFEGRDDNNNRVDWSSTIHFTKENEWEFFSVTTRAIDFDAISLVSYMKIYTYASSYVNPVEFRLSAPQIEKKPYPTPFVNEVREGTVKDYSINNNHAILDENTPKWIENSIVGEGSYEFNGINTRIVTDNSTELQINGDSSFSWWSKATSYSHVPFITLLRKSSVGEFQIEFRNSGGRIIFFQGNSDDGYDPIYNLYLQGNQINNWYHYVVVRNDSEKTVSIYQNGIYVNSLNYHINIGITSDPISIGARVDGGRPFQGIIDDVRIYNRVLSPDEIKILFETNYVR